MKKARWISAAISTAVLTAGFVLPAGAAFADGPSGNGNAGVISAGSGNNENAPVSIPVSVCGVARSVAGFANAHCKGGATSNTVINGGNGGGGSGNAGTAAIDSGNNVNAPVSAPVSVCGIAVGVLGFSNAGCEGGSFSNTLINP